MSIYLHIIGYCIQCIVAAGTLKTQDMKHRERKRRHQNSGVKTARNGNNGTMLQGVENERYEHSAKAEYRKPLIVKYRYTRSAAVGEC